MRLPPLIDRKQPKEKVRRPLSSKDLEIVCGGDNDLGEVTVTASRAHVDAVNAAYDRATMEVYLSNYITAGILGALGYAGFGGAGGAAVMAIGSEINSDMRDAAIEGLATIYIDYDAADGIWGNDYFQPVFATP